MDIVYRALNEKDIENIEAGLGLVPKNPSANGTPLEHVLHGSTPGYGDQYISFTRDEKFAEIWASKAGTKVVSVDLDELHNAKVDLSTPEERIAHLGDVSRVPKGDPIHTANNVDPLKDLILDRSIPSEYQEYSDIISS